MSGTGTSSLTRVIDAGKGLVACFKQYHGYPSGYGLQLGEFLASGKVTHGIPQPVGTLAGSDAMKVHFHDAGCLAAQMIARFKVAAGGYYVEHYDVKDVAQKYEYEVNISKHGDITLICYLCTRSSGFQLHVVFAGSVNQFINFCKSGVYR